jgi:hypothetical protein
MAVAAQLDARLGEGVPPLQGDLRFGFEVGDVGKPQKIEAPRAAAPAAELEGIPGFDGLGSTGRGSSGTKPPQRNTGGGSAKPGKTRSNGTSSARKRSEQAYISCVQQTRDAAALDKCQALLP